MGRYSLVTPLSSTLCACLDNYKEPVSDVVLLPEDSHFLSLDVARVMHVSEFTGFFEVLGETNEYGKKPPHE